MKIKQLLSGIVVALMTSVASASVSIISFNGVDVANVTSTSIDFVEDAGTVSPLHTGIFSGISTGTVANFFDFTYAPFTSPTKLWSIGGNDFVFYMDSFTLEAGSDGNNSFDANGTGTLVLNEGDLNESRVFSYYWDISASGGEGTMTWQQTTKVPEPATVALLGLGLAGLGIARRKQK